MRGDEAACIHRSDDVIFVGIFYAGIRPGSAAGHDLEDAALQQDDELRVECEGREHLDLSRPAGHDIACLSAGVEDNVSEADSLPCHVVDGVIGQLFKRQQPFVGVRGWNDGQDVSPDAEYEGHVRVLGGGEGVAGGVENSYQA